ncbi:MAG TPA: sigma-70 family RNA polymerase sigma factor [Candidatus Peribacterales bacterium]|nr:sigma-70 family RNA polymerase sigma factor [Candidatus Peribacterales bacterium]
MALLRTTSATRGKTGILGAVAIIERDGKILLQRRREHIADSGTWVLPGGACRKGEETRDALVRVCAEELGVSVRPSKEIGIMMVAETACPVWHVIWKGEEIKFVGKDTVGIGWFTPEELLELEPVREQEAVRTFLEENQSLQSIIAGASHHVHTEEQKVEHAKILTLVSKAKEGNHEAFAEIYDAYVTPIHRYVAFRLPPAVVEDIVADVFVKAWEKLDSFQERKNIPFSSWLFRIAKHVVIDSYRTQKEVVELDEFHIDEDRWNDPALKITQDVQGILLRQAMNKLPHRYREVLLLSFMSGLDHAEIARTMRSREGSVRILKHRALKKLGELLPASMREELP